MEPIDQPTKRIPVGPAEALMALEGLSMLLKIINQAVASARERGEWTPEQEAEFDAKLESVKSNPAWVVRD